MIIRKINKNDLKTLVEFSKRTFTEAFAHLNNPDDFNAFIESAFNTETLEKELNNVQRDAYGEGSLFYFMENKGIVAGLLKLNVFKAPSETHAPTFYSDTHFNKKDMLEIERIYVDAPFHGKGLAAILMQQAEAVARQNNCSEIWLGVWSENHKAIRFYEKCGFTTFGEHVFTVGTDDQIDILMIKRL